MGKIHRFEFDAYRVGDRLLDGVSFAILVEIDGQSARIQGVEPWSDGDRDLLKGIDFDYFTQKARDALQEDLDYLMESYAEDGGSFAEDMAEFEDETGLPGIQMLAEI